MGGEDEIYGHILIVANSVSGAEWRSEGIINREASVLIDADL